MPLQPISSASGMPRTRFAAVPSLRPKDARPVVKRAAEPSAHVPPSTTLESLTRESREATAHADGLERRLFVWELWSKVAPAAVPFAGHVGAAIGFGQLAGLAAHAAEPLGAARFAAAIPAAIATAAVAVANAMPAQSPDEAAGVDRVASVALGATVLASQVLAGPAGVAAAMMGASGALVGLSNVRAIAALLHRAQPEVLERQKALAEEAVAHRRKALELAVRVQELLPRVKALQAALEPEQGEAPAAPKRRDV